MEIDEEGLEKVAERFLRRNEVQAMGLSLEDVKKVLIAHAQKYGGCVNCVYSKPYRGRFSWVCRSCILGLSQSNCNMRKPIVKP